MTCPVRRHLIKDDQVELLISFNDQEFIRLSQSVDFVNDIRPYTSVPAYSIFYTPTLYQFLLKLQDP